MSPPNIYYSAALSVAGIICFIVAAVIWQMRRASAGAVSLMILMLALSWWDLTYALFWAGAPAPSYYFWLDSTYVGVVIVPLVVFVFTLQLTRYGHWVKRPLILALCVEPVLVLFFLFTDPWFNLFFGGKRLPGMGMIPNGGPIFWANIVYSYGLVLFSTILIVRSFWEAVGLYRKQLSWLLIGIGVSWLNSLIFIVGLRPFPNADNTPFSFSILGIAFTFALLRYHLLDVVPIARDKLIESMSEGVIVLDAQSRVVDVNPVVQKEMNLSLLDSVIGQPIEKAFPQWIEFIKAFRDVNEAQVEIPIGDPPRRYLDLRISPLADNRHHLIGRLFVWRDITELKFAQIELHELATQDSLTQAFNRRHFVELANQELPRSIRFKYPLALILLDIDNFKNINDHYGHLVGDQVLAAFVKICQRNIRGPDLFARWGGDEFIFLLRETVLEQASQFAERLSAAVTQSPILVEDLNIPITISLGISTMASEKDTLEIIVARADEALYAAKEAGRNRAVIWNAQLNRD